MRNWSGSVQWQPTQVAKPDSEQAIQSIVQKAASNKQNIRLIGTGHSFTRLCETNEILMSLDNYQGLISVDKEKMLATVKGGTKLHYLGDLLYAEGLAMENLGGYRCPVYCRNHLDRNAWNGNRIWYHQYSGKGAEVCQWKRGNHLLL